MRVTPQTRLRWKLRFVYPVRRAWRRRFGPRCPLCGERDCRRPEHMWS